MNKQQNAATDFDPSDQPFQAVSKRIVTRLFLRNWFTVLGRTALVVYPVAGVLALLAWFFSVPVNLLLASAVLVPAWLLLTAAWAWLRRPTPEVAFARWDESARRKEMFVSAYCFEKQAEKDTGEELHLRHAKKRLQVDISSLSQDLPTPFQHHVWALPLALILLVSLLMVPQSVAQGPGMDDGAQDRAKEVADALAEQIKQTPEEEGLTPEEKEELKKLKEEIQEAMDALREIEKESPRDVLAELEEKAHAAEMMAAELDSATEEQLSSKMLEELARHADTTEFAAAMQAMDLQKGSDEAMNLSKKLDDAELALEQQQRIETALDKALKVATDEDKKTTVGKELEDANTDLAKEKPKDAAKDLKELSDKLAEAKQREMAKERLEQLAEQLRNSGQKIFGQKPSNIRRLAENNENGLQQLGAQQLQNMENLPLQQMGNQPNGQSPPPGTPLAAATPNLPAALGQAPIPGLPTSLGMPMTGLPAPIPGTGQCQGGQCQGQGQGQGLAQGQGQGQGQGLSPVPGMGAGNGGLMAGHGSAGYANQKTNPLGATDTGVVNAQLSGDGPSQLREVEPQSHREDAARKSKQIAINFIKTEEEALFDEPLPLSRREQVLRYFTALRRRLVEYESTEQPTE